MPGHQLRPERADKSGGRTFLGPPSYRDSAGPRDVAQEAGRVLTLTGLHRRLEIFPTVQAAATGAQAARHGTRGAAARGRAARACPGPAHRPTGPSPAPAGAGDLRGAVAALLACADAWHDADPRRRFTPALAAMARARDGTDDTALERAARSLLSALARHPLTPTPAVAATATRLRRALHPASLPAPV